MGLVRGRQGQLRVWQHVTFCLLVLLTMGSGPCYCDDCHNPGQGWCDGTAANVCEGSPNQSYQLWNEDCAAKGLSCVSGQGWAACVDLRPCETVGAYVCEPPDAQGERHLWQCVDVDSASWNEGGLTTPSDATYVLEPVGAGDGGVGEACSSCQSTCGCEPGRLCHIDGCVPGNPEVPPTCCGRERAGDCPKGEPCENQDGSEGVCTTAARCESCATNLDCESNAYQCISTGSGVPAVCLEYGATETHECRDGTNQVWALDPCGAWLELIEDCGADYHCENADCVLNVPDIEVSPMLLPFGNVALGADTTLTVSIGNLGHATLHVNEIEVEAVGAASFTVVPTAVDVPAPQIVPVSVTFHPVSLGLVAARLYVRSDDPDEPEVTVLMNGTGTSP